MRVLGNLLPAKNTPPSQNKPQKTPSGDHIRGYREKLGTSIASCTLHGPCTASMPSALIVTFAQSTVLNAISNLLAQLIDQRKNTVSSRESPTKRPKNKPPKKQYQISNIHLDSFHTQHTRSPPIRHIWHPNRANQFLLATRPGDALPRISLTSRDLKFPPLLAISFLILCFSIILFICYFPRGYAGCQR